MKKTSVNAIIYSEGLREVLAIKRRDVPIWVLPGGLVDKGEAPEEAVVREVLEETGLKVSIIRKSGCYFPVNRLAHETHVFECRALEGQPTTGEETREISYFSLETLPVPFFYVHKDMLNDARQYPTETVIKPLAQVTYRALAWYFLRHPLHVIRFTLSRLGIPINS